MVRLDPVQPLRKDPDYAQASRPSRPFRVAEGGLPSQEKIGSDVVSMLLVGKSDKSPQDPLSRAKVITEAATNCEVAVKLFG